MKYYTSSEDKERPEQSSALTSNKAQRFQKIHPILPQRTNMSVKPEKEKTEGETDSDL